MRIVLLLEFVDGFSKYSYCLPIVLVPDKGSSGASFLHHELSVVVVDLSSQQLFHCPSHFLTSPHHPSDVVARVIP